MDITRRGFLGGMAAVAVAPVKVLAHAPALVDDLGLADMVEPVEGITVALFDGAGEELSGNGYARVRFQGNGSPVTFPMATGPWGEIHDWGLFDGEGNCLVVGSTDRWVHMKDGETIVMTPYVTIG